MFQNPTTPSQLVRLVGGALAAFSLVIGLLVMFVIPGGCSFVGSIQLVMLGFMFVVGIVCYLLGQTLIWMRRTRSQA